MAGLNGVLTASGEIALTGGAAKTVLQLTAPANQNVLIRQVSVSFDGTTSTNEPVLVNVQRQTTAGTGTSRTPLKEDDSQSSTIQSTGAENFTVEPTAGDILAHEEVHPQGGGVTLSFPPGQELVVAGGGRLGIKCTAPQSVNCVASIRFTE